MTEDKLVLALSNMPPWQHYTRRVSKLSPIGNLQTIRYIAQFLSNLPFKKMPLKLWRESVPVNVSKEQDVPVDRSNMHSRSIYRNVLSDTEEERLYRLD
jgi:hypothetical protein